MVVDTSALISIMGDEPERHTFNKLIEAAEDPCISAASLLETRMVLFARSGDSAILALDAFLLKSGMTVVEVSPRIADIAFDAYRHFGKGDGSRCGPELWRLFFLCSGQVSGCAASVQGQ